MPHGKQRGEYARKAGIELGENMAVAVALDDLGAIRARAERPLAGDPAGAYPTRGRAATLRRPSLTA